MTKDEKNALLAIWCLSVKPRLYGFLVKTVYQRGNIEEIAQRVYEYVLYKEDLPMDSYEKFVSYVIKTAQGFTYSMALERQGYIKPTMHKAHGEIARHFTDLQKDLSNEKFIYILDKKDNRRQVSITPVGKKELLEFAKPHLTDKQFSVLELRLYGYSLSEIGEQLGISAKSVSSHVELYQKRLQKLLNNS